MLHSFVVLPSTILVLQEHRLPFPIDDEDDPFIERLLLDTDMPGKLPDEEDDELPDDRPLDEDAEDEDEDDDDPFELDDDEPPDTKRFELDDEPDDSIDFEDDSFELTSFLSEDALLEAAAIFVESVFIIADISLNRLEILDECISRALISCACRELSPVMRAVFSLPDFIPNVLICSSRLLIVAIEELDEDAALDSRDATFSFNDAT